jgi:hypothetical protein
VFDVPSASRRGAAHLPRLFYSLGTQLAPQLPVHGGPVFARRGDHGLLRDAQLAGECADRHRPADQMLEQHTVLEPGIEESGRKVAPAWP